MKQIYLKRLSLGSGLLLLAFSLLFAYQRIDKMYAPASDSKEPIHAESSLTETRILEQAKGNSESVLKAELAKNAMMPLTCDCTDYLYVNDPSLDITHKFVIDDVTGGISGEIGSPWLSARQIINPHGVAGDLNGNLYIAQLDQSLDPTTNNLFKVDCDGNIVDGDFIPGWGSTFNLLTIGNTVYSMGQPSGSGLTFAISAFNTCTKALVAQLEVEPPGPDVVNWGMSLGLDGKIYATSSWGGITGDINVYRVEPDLSSFTTVVSIPNVDSDIYTLGVTADEFGNIYFVVNSAGPTGNDATTIYKYDSDGNFIHSISDNALDQSGFGGAWGIKYYEDSGKLYIGTLGDDCVAVIDAGGQNGNMVYQAALGIPHVPGTYSKAINIVRECCPTQATAIVDTTLCGSDVAVNDQIFLQDLINCNGTICEGTWQADGGNMGLTYNSCDNSITIDALGACGSFTLESDGTGNNPQCGAFEITVNIQVADVTAPVVNGDQNLCSGEDPVAFTVDTPASANGTLEYQWEQSTTSCSTGFSIIAGATNDTYDPPANILQTTYYRLITSINDGGCGTGMCQDTSNCITVNVTSCLSIGSTVFIDADNDGLFETGAGETGIPNVNLEVWDVGANMIKDTPLGSVDDVRVGTPQTDMNGNWIQTNLAEGKYVVVIPSTEFGAGMALEDYGYSSDTTDEMDNGEDDDDNGIQTAYQGMVMSPVIMLSDNDEPTNTDPMNPENGSGNTADDTDDDNGDMTVDFGFYPPASLGDYVWEDLDNDGTQDMGEPPIEGVKVILYECSGGTKGDSITMTTTNMLGQYIFEDLGAMEYCVEFDASMSNHPQAANLQFSLANEIPPATEQSDSDADDSGCTESVTLTPDEDYEDLDAGLLARDYGDLPEGSYQTSAPNGPSHIVSANPLVYIGTGVDADPDGQPNGTATGDLEETEVNLPAMLFVGESAEFTMTIVNNSIATAKIIGFIDWDANGDFDELNEMQQQTVTAMTTQSVTLTFSVPSNAVTDTNLGARFRVSTDPDFITNMPATGSALDGEVEDYLVQVKALDFGDLPDDGISNTPDYSTNYNDDGPRHGLPPTPLVFFGDGVEEDADGQASTDADGDAEEDDVTLPAMLFRGEAATFNMNVTNNSDSTAKVVAYIDWNGDGDFEEAGEMASSDPIAAMNVNIPVAIPIDVPFDAVVDSLVGARFRISTDTSTIMGSANGFAMDGEVEDYLITIKDLDFGDLPDDTVSDTPDYNTDYDDNGPRHGLPATPLVFIGDGVEQDDDGQTSTDADGDAEENDVTIPTMLFRGENAVFNMNVTNNSDSTAKVVAYIDWNGDGDFEEAGEMASSDPIAAMSVNAAIAIPIDVPLDAVVDSLVGARFRVSTDTSTIMGSANGFAMDGEVEDYLISIKDLDFGDLPDDGISDTPDYATDYDDDGPRHGLPPTPLVFFGDGVEEDADGQASTNADGDAEEDDITLPAMLFRGESATFNLNVTNNSDSTAKVVAYFDWNGDGDFEEADEMASSNPIAAMSVDAAISIPIDVPLDAVVDSLVGARFRVSTDTSTIMSSANGFAMDGEVEDYLITIKDLDFGDLPDDTVGDTPDYATDHDDDGPRHGLPPTPLVFFGDGVEEDADGQASTDADGDAEEDDIILPAMLFRGEDAIFNMNVTNNSDSTAKVVAYFDWNGDGDFEEAGEMASSDPIAAMSINATISIPIDVPFDAVVDSLVGARFRVSTDTSTIMGSANGFAMDGEVEDYLITIKDLDFGDLPDDGISDTPDYLTDYNDDGPRHGLPATPLVFFGDGVEGDGDGQASTDADGDTEEDDITLPAMLFRGEDAVFNMNVTNNSDSTAKVVAYFDWNGDGDFEEAGEMASSDPIAAMSINAAISIPIDVPFDAVVDSLVGARFRISTDTSTIMGSANGFAMDGEVEDYLITIKDLDFGDLPDDTVSDTPDYNTDYDDNGPRHGLPSTPLVFIGDGVEQDDDGQTSTDADGDAEEDDVTIPTMLFRGENAVFNMNVTNNSDSTAKVVAYIDWNGDGDFGESNEMGSSDPIAAMSTNEAVSISIPIPLNTVVDSLVGARFRISTDTSTIMASADGFAMDGEVEDYMVSIKGVDYGDAPDPDYPTTAASDGARHGVPATPVLFLGTTVDIEEDGQQQGTANGDDNNNDDEDGVVFEDIEGNMSMIVSCEMTTIVVTASAPGFLNAWLDYNGNGSWGDSGEQIFADEALVAGQNELTFTSPCDIAASTERFLRFRFNSTGGLSPTGFAMDGEVEDYTSPVKGLDFGDLPDPDYPTLYANDPARHVIPAIPGLFLGMTVDAESEGQQSVMADGDGSDEDGITLVTPMIPGSMACIEVSTTVPADVTAYLHAWIDFNGDGSLLEAGDQIISNRSFTPADNGTPTILCFDVPSTATFDGGMALLRARFGPEQDLLPTGISMGGEVEDHKFLLGKVGNLVWQDNNYDGIQGDATTEPGINDIEIILTWAGPDGDIDMVDDNVTYSDTTTTLGGKDGIYYFCGLIDGDYSLEVNTNRFATLTGEGTATTDNNNEDGTPFSISLANLLTGEDGTSDMPGMINNFPDNQDNQSFDFGYAGLDFGDLPDGFETQLGDGPVHAMNPNIFLGSCVDGEVDGAPDDDAGLGGSGGDDGTPGVISFPPGVECIGDEDGIQLLTSMIPGSEACIQVTSTMPDDEDGVLNAWIDFNGNGQFDEGEQLEFTKFNGGDITPTTEGPIPMGTDQVTELCYIVPEDATFDGLETHLRFRLSPDGGLDSDGVNEDGSYPLGEVEDYYQPLAKVGNYAWLDVDEDGVQDANEPPLAGVDVRLYRCDDDVKGIQEGIELTTDENGFYEFNGLLPGEYCLAFEADEIYDPFTGIPYEISPSGSGSDDGIDSNPQEDGCTESVILDPLEDDPTVDAGIIVDACYPPFSLATADCNEHGATISWKSINGDEEEGLNDHCWKLAIAGAGPQHAVFGDLGILLDLLGIGLEASILEITVCEGDPGLTIMDTDDPQVGMMTYELSSDLLQAGTAYWFAVAEVCNDAPDLGNNSPWNFQRFFPITLLDEGAFPGTDIATEYDWDDYEGYFRTKDYPFEIAVSGESPSCPSYTEEYTPDGCLIVEITDGMSCIGTYDIYIDEVLQRSGVLATDGPFSFCGYGIGTYDIEVELTNECFPAERVQAMEFELEEGIDDISPQVILADYFAGALVADNLDNTTVTEIADLGEMTLPEGACSMKSYFIFTGTDNCDNVICTDDAVTATVIDGNETVDPGTQVQLYHLSGEVVTEEGVILVEDCEWVVEINWAVGSSTVEICMDDSELVDASAPACIQLTAEVLDTQAPQIIATPINATIPVCDEEVDVIYGFNIVDGCDQYIESENIELVGVDYELLTSNNGYFEYLLNFDASGNGTFTISYEDLQGTIQEAQVSYVVTQAAEETAPQIIAQGGTFSALACEDGAEVVFTVHVIDDCDAITEKIGISGEGSEGLNATPITSVDTRGYVTFSGVLPADEYQFTFSYPGAADVPITIIVEQEDNRPALIDLPGNTTFTIPSCGDEVNATWSIQISDDCDEDIDLAEVCIQIGGGSCLGIPSTGLQVLSNENGATLIEMQKVLTAADNGSILAVSYTDGAGNTSQASQAITVHAGSGVDVIPPVIVYPTEGIHVELDPCGPNTTEVVFSVSANDNCSGWVPVQLNAPESLAMSAVSEGNAQKWTIGYAARETPYAVSLQATDEAGNSTDQTIWISVTQEKATSASLSCNTNLTALVDEYCQYRISKDLALEGDFGCLTDDDIEILVDDGDDDIAEGIGEHTFTVYIKGDVYCYGSIDLFDNIPPTIECPVTSTDFICTDLDQLLGTLEHTGSPIVNDNCSATWEWTEEVLYGEDETCDEQQIRRVFTATDASGLNASCEQYISIRKPTLDEVLAPAEVLELSCDEILGYNEQGYPLPAKTGGFPYVETYFGNQNLQPLFCNLAATYSDSERIDFCDNGYKFTRTWKVLDWCDAPNTVTFSQLIKVGDFEAPSLSAPEVDYDWDGEFDLLEYSTGPFDCTASFEIPLPIVTDNCSADFSIDIEVLANGDTPILEIEDGESRYISDIPLGCHAFRYTVKDACGNRAELVVPFTVKDKIAPTAICDDELQISVESNGLARVFATEIDEGSWDNCTDVMVEVRRQYTTDENCAAIEETFSMWGDYVDFSCCDIGRAVRIELRVWDDANGDGIYGNTISQLDCTGEPVVVADNSNVCWLDVVVEDKLDAFCVAPHSQTIACDALPYDFDPSDLALLEDLFGEATAGDNCPGIGVIEDTPVITLDDCGTGTILRSFSTQSADGSNLNNSCQQLITITEVHNYEIRFPADSDADCGAPNPDTITINEIGCDLLAVSVADEFFSASGQECYKILRTYRVINWCEYDGDGAPVIVGRDEDCDDQPGDEAVWVLRRPDGTVYFDRNNDETDNIPVAYTKGRDCDGLANPSGYWIDSHIDEDATRDPITGQVDNGTTNDEIRQIDSRGYWQYTQVIKVYDSVDPAINVAEFDEFEALNSTDCTGQVAISFTIEDECTQEEGLVIAALDAYIVDADQDGNITQAEFNADADISDDLVLEDGVYVYEADLPIGNHALLLKGSDGCGNETAKLVLFSVVDRKAPAPICISGLAIELMPTEPGTDADGDGDEDAAAMAIWANDFTASPVYDCNGQGPGTDENGNLLITRYSINLLDEEAHPDSTGLILTCDSEETTIVEIHAWDELGNHDYCETFILVQDLMNRCESASGSIAGMIETEESEGISGVEIQLSGPMTEQFTTQQDGFYLFDNLPVNDYSVTPHLDQDYLNGVTTFDLILITQHILGTNALGSPYRMIAADVNNSRSITTLDVIEARRRILGIGEGFTNNTSWRFVAKDYEFPDPNNPWIEDFPELKSFNDLDGEATADFLGVKIADVNGSVLPNNFSQLDERSAGEFALQLEDIRVTAGQQYRVAVSSDQLESIDGYQGTFLFDASIELEAIEYGAVQAEHFNLRVLKEGLLPISWNGKTTAKTELFTFVLTAHIDGQLSELIQLSSRITPAEAYDTSGQLLDLTLDFGEGRKQGVGFELYQNQPNPFNDQTWISFYLPKESAVLISIYDGSGKIIRQLQGDFARGRQSVVVEQKDLPATGILFYRVTAGENTATRKMIVK